MDTNNKTTGMNPAPITNKHIGPIVVVLVLVLVIIIGSLYYFVQKLNNTPANNVTPTNIQEGNQSTTTVSNDSAAAINTDLDSQLKDIDYSF